MGRTAQWLALAVLVPAQALAQTTTASSASKASPTSTSHEDGATVKAVTITAHEQDYKSSIDRRSYSLGKDLRTTNGSLGDALRNIPSVQVDVQGNISLRGDSNVTILVDGKPSGLFQGQNRADALQQLPADQFERVEVMTNPSAAFQPDGTAGIINLVTKKGRGLGGTGSLRANAGTGGRGNASVSGSYNSYKLSLTGGAGVRRDASSTDTRSESQFVDPVTGKLTPTHYQTRGHTVGSSTYAYGSLDYDVDDKDRLSADLNHSQWDYGGPSNGQHRSDAATGPLAQDYGMAARYSGHGTYTGGSASFVHKFSGDDHEVSLRLSRNDNHSDNQSQTTFAYQEPIRPNLYQDLLKSFTRANTELKAEYKGPLPGGSKLVTGYELRIEQATFDNWGALGTDPADAMATPSITNLFKYGQTVHALYATYQRPFGRFTIMPGLRFEQALIDIDQVTSQLRDSWSYFEAYPTLHMAYRLSNRENLTASYSRRVQRPDPQMLNPYRIYGSPYYYTQGNPRLMPEVTDSYELGYEYRKSSTYYVATLFFRQKSQSFTTVEQDLGGGVVLNTNENLGRSRSGGLELVSAGHFTKALSYNVSGDVFWNEINASNLGFTQPRSDLSFFGHANLNWEPTRNDFAQLNLYGSGRQLTPQGYRDPTWGMNLGYRHKFTKKLWLVMTVQDPFDTSRQTFVVDTPTLKSRYERINHVRALYLGFTYAFGGPGAHKPESFDYGGETHGPQ